MEQQFIETELTNWKDIFLLDSKLHRQLIYRGQSNKEWNISSSIERLLERLHPNYIDKALVCQQERQMLKEFCWKYPLFKNKIIDDNNHTEWLAIMQHYGSATRLVDFTESFFIAVHMAIYDSDNDACVWALNKHVVGSYAFSLYREKKSTNQTSQQELDKFALELANQKIEKSFTITEKELLIIRPKNSNERIYKQQGLFVMPTNIQVPFMDCLMSNINTPKLFWDFRHLIKNSDSYKQSQFSVIKINIPREIHRQILRNLREMNINSEILFPGIEGLAKSLNYSTFNDT